MTQQTTMNPIRLSHWLALAGYFSLMAGFYLWHLWLQPLEKHLISIVLLLQLGPLMLPLFGLLKGKVYTHAWSMYLAIYYFIVGVWYAGDDGQFYFGLYIVFTSLVFFTGTLFYARLAGRAQKQSQQPPEHQGKNGG